MENIFLYQRKYKEQSLSKRLQSFSFRVKKLLLLALVRSPLKKMIDPGDSYQIRHEKKTHFFDQERKKYGGVRLSKVKFFEAFNIDEFSKHEALILNNIREDWRGPFRTDRTKLRESFQKIKESLDTVQYDGNIGYMVFDKYGHSHLIKDATIGYIKTRESYFILTIEVNTSVEFQRIFESIIQSDDFSPDEIVFNSFVDLIRTRKFVRHTKSYISSIDLSIHNLVSDLNYQVKRNITTKLQGNFNQQRLLPSLEYFEVDSMEGFNEDRTLSSTIARQGSRYELDDKKICICLRPNYSMRIVKEKGHGTRPKRTGT